MRRRPVLREADVGRGAADVERDHVVVAGLLAGPDAADDARDGARHEQVDGSRDRPSGVATPLADVIRCSSVLTSSSSSCSSSRRT